MQMHVACSLCSHAPVRRHPLAGSCETVAPWLTLPELQHRLTSVMKHGICYSHAAVHSSPADMMTCCMCCLDACRACCLKVCMHDWWRGLHSDGHFLALLAGISSSLVELRDMIPAQPLFHELRWPPASACVPVNTYAWSAAHMPAACLSTIRDMHTWTGVIAGMHACLAWSAGVP